MLIKINLLDNPHLTMSRIDKLLRCGIIKSYIHYGGYVEIELYPQIERL